LHGWNDGRYDIGAARYRTLSGKRFDDLGELRGDLAGRVRGRERRIVCVFQPARTVAKRYISDRLRQRCAVWIDARAFGGLREYRSVACQNTPASASQERVSRIIGDRRVARSFDDLLVGLKDRQYAE